MAGFDLVLDNLDLSYGLRLIVSYLIHDISITIAIDRIEFCACDGFIYGSEYGAVSGGFVIALSLNCAFDRCCHNFHGGMLDGSV